MHYSMRINQSMSQIHPDKQFIRGIMDFSYSLRLTLIKDYCLSFIVKEDNFYEIVMSNAFANLDKPLMVEIIRKRLNPGRNMDIKFDKTAGELRIKYH